MKKCITALLVLCCLVSCDRQGKKIPKPDKEQFISVYADLIRLQQTLPPTHPAYLDSARTIMQKYDFSKQTYEDNLAYFHAKPKRWKKFYDTVYKRLQETSEAEETPAIN